MAIKDLSGRSAARARRNAQVKGKGSATAAAPAATVSAASAPRRSASASSSTSGSCRQESLARRRQMSTKGKAGVAAPDRQRVARTTAKAKVATAKGCGCGCNGEGKCKDSVAAAAPSAPVFAKPASVPTQMKKVNVVSPSNKGRMNSRARRHALAAHGKKGVEIMNNGTSSAQMARSQNPDITSRDLARSVRAQRSVSGGSAVKAKSAPIRGNRPSAVNSEEVTGTQVAHSAKTTGDEIGLCRSVTGTDYLSDDVFASYCQSGNNQFNAPSKVLTSALARGGNITTASSVGRSDSVTGDEHGSCKNVTGTEYLGTEHFEQFCGVKPDTGPAKVSFSQTSRGKIVSGSKPARSEQVTGDEAGTCKAVTGTPYAGSEQYEKYCEPGQAKVALARNELRSGNAGRDITGIQPGLGNLTGADKGVCKPLTGTSYVGATDHQQVCGATPAQMGESDFPKPLAGAPWGDFSVEAPNHASQSTAQHNSVTGSRYEQGRISGTFSLGEGKLTGTEEARFGDRVNNTTGNVNAPVAVAKPTRGVTGEGMETGMNITGDDWDRNERVTGTEGRSSAKRNPTRRGPISAMPGVDNKRNVDVAPADLNVTGSHGNTDSGAPVTLSGGARG